MVYQGATGLYHFVINVIPFISNSVGSQYMYTRYGWIVINVLIRYLLYIKCGKFLFRDRLIIKYHHNG